MASAQTQIIPGRLPTTRQQAIAWSRNLLARTNWVILDTETTGTDKYHDRVIEVTILSEKADTLFHSLINPERAIPPETQAYNGITDEDVRQAPTLPAVWSDIAACLKGKWVVCYNAEFDAIVLRESGSVYGLGLGKLYTYCAMKVYLAYAGGLTGSGRMPYFRLADACARHGIPTGQSHRSSSDCLATLRLIQHMAATQEDEPIAGSSSCA